MEDIEDRKDIEMLVNVFYDNLQKDEALDYLFNEVAKVDWKSHLPKMYDFWETLLFHKAVYKGNPMRVHMQLDQMQSLKKEDFESWLQIFKKTIDDLFIGEKAELAKTRALSVATSIQLNTVYKN